MRCFWLLMVCVCSVLVACGGEFVPDYVQELGGDSEVFEKLVLPKSAEDNDAAGAVIVNYSRETVFTGVYRDMVTFVPRPDGVFEDQLDVWFVDHGFNCMVIHASEQHYPMFISRVYQKGNAFMHVFWYWTPKKIPGLHAALDTQVHVAVIQYDDVTQVLYPCGQPTHGVPAHSPPSSTQDFLNTPVRPPPPARLPPPVHPPR